MRSVFATLILTSLVCAGTAVAQLPPTGFEVGQRFPPLVLPDVDTGVLVSTDDYFASGKRVIVAVFASW